MRILEILSNSNRTFSQICEKFPVYFSTPEIKIKTTEDKKFGIVDEVKEYCHKLSLTTILEDGVRIQYEDGWALVRASNTGPNLTLRFEAKTEDRLKKIKEEYMTLVQKLNEE